MFTIRMIDRENLVNGRIENLICNLINPQIVITSYRGSDISMVYLGHYENCGELRAAVVCTEGEKILLCSVDSNELQNSVNMYVEENESGLDPVHANMYGVSSDTRAYTCLERLIAAGTAVN